ncbi:hypothetical protein AYI69_g4473 [Smittium culicis]|uniref:Uncharacterized protein n=1 Tax=Smittium culicis TaxID=133412 RepID=A0A1R1YDC8_9FUNG|nr:hypothetical protein AYI69_g4473 [Smittium culicis]
MSTSSNSSLEKTPPIYGDNYLEDEFLLTRLPDYPAETTVPSSRNIAENQEGFLETPSFSLVLKNNLDCSNVSE